MPIEVPPEHTRPVSIKEDLQRYIRYQVSQAAQDDGFATFEEEDDFQEEDLDEDWSSEYEFTDTQAEAGFGPEETLDGPSEPSSVVDPSPTAKGGEPNTGQPREPEPAPATTPAPHQNEATER